MFSAINESVQASEKSLSKTVFSLQINNEPMPIVLAKISNASGYTIVINAEMDDVKLSIRLIDVTLQEAVRRIFQNYNHVEIWNDEKKKLELRIWDAKGAPVSLSGKKRVFSPRTKTFQ